MKITLTMDEEIAQVLMDATEFYSRVLCGQYEEIARKVSDARMDHIVGKKGENAWETEYKEVYSLASAAESALAGPKHIQFPELGAIGHNYGLGYSRMTDISFNIYQAVRYACAWNRHPEGGATVDFHTPSAHKLPIPKVEIDGKCYIDGNASFGDDRRDEDDDNIRYWIYEIEMGEDEKQIFKEVCRENELTPDEMFQKSLINTMRYAQMDPEGYKQSVADFMAKSSEDNINIRLVRYYPVYKGETEAQARKRKLAEEAAESSKDENSKDQ